MTLLAARLHSIAIGEVGLLLILEEAISVSAERWYLPGM